MNESFPRILYNCPKVDSMKALEAPNSAMTHIQKIAPGPPMAMAVATPARFPCQVARTHTAGNRNSECLKRRYMFLSLFSFAGGFA